MRRIIKFIGIPLGFVMIWWATIFSIASVGLRVDEGLVIEAFIAAILGFVLGYWGIFENLNEE